MQAILAKATNFAQPMKEILAKATNVSVGYPCLDSSGLWLVKKGDMARLLFSVPSLGSNLTGQAGKFQGKVISILQCIHALVTMKDSCGRLHR
jgi:hypothetical protein